MGELVFIRMDKTKIELVMLKIYLKEGDMGRRAVWERELYGICM